MPTPPAGVDDPATPTPRAEPSASTGPHATETPGPDHGVAQLTNPAGPDPADFPNDNYPFFEIARELPSFGQLWLDDNQRDVHLALTGDVDAAIEAIRDQVPRGITVYFHIVEHTEAELCALRDAIFADRDELMRRGIVLMSGGCGSMENRVDIGLSPLTPEVLDYMRARYDGPIDYGHAGETTLGPYEPPDLGAVRLVAIREGDDPGLLTCGRRPFPEAALDCEPRGIGRPGPEYEALREGLDAYTAIYGDLTELGWIRAERDDYGATFIADRGDTWLEAPVYAGRGGWVPGTIDYCSPAELLLDGRNGLSVYLDPAFPPPAAESTEVHLLVEEQACASGRSPANRLLPPTIRYTEQRVTLHFHLRPTGGFATCPANPRLPVTIELPEPLGDRTFAGLSTPPD
jgi:hypothetical protein